LPRGKSPGQAEILGMGERKNGENALGLRVPHYGGDCRGAMRMISLDWVGNTWECAWN